MKLFGNSAYGKCKKIVSTTYGNEGNISKTINGPHLKDLEQLYGILVIKASKKRVAPELCNDHDHHQYPHAQSQRQRANPHSPL
jgi:hypothetical protein